MIPKGKDIEVTKPDGSLGPILALMHEERWVEHKLKILYIQGLLRKNIEPIRRYGRPKPRWR